MSDQDLIALEQRRTQIFKRLEEIQVQTKKLGQENWELELECQNNLEKRCQLLGGHHMVTTSISLAHGAVVNSYCAACKKDSWHDRMSRSCICGSGLHV